MAKILLVEDDFALTEMVTEALKQRGHAVSHAADGEAALKAARRDSPDVVLLDVMLPGLDGFAVCRALRTEPGTSAVKVIMMTALGQMSNVEAAFSAGATDYIIKPFAWPALFKKIDAVLQK